MHGLGQVLHQEVLRVLGRWRHWVRLVLPRPVLPYRYLVVGLEALIHEVDLLGLGALLERGVLRRFILGGLLAGVELLFLDELRLFVCGGAAALVQRYVEVMLKLAVFLVWILLGFLDEQF